MRGNYWGEEHERERWNPMSKWLDVEECEPLEIPVKVLHPIPPSHVGLAPEGDWSPRWGAGRGGAINP